MAVSTSGKHTFSYEEAVSLLPRVRELTAEAYRRVEHITEGVASLEELGPAAHAEVDRLVADWARAMEGLGAEVKGLWLVDFDNGSGYYCWRHPEVGLRFFHTYEAGFGGRIPIQ
jgi:hypothetical protein